MSPPGSSLRPEAAGPAGSDEGRGGPLRAGAAPARPARLQGEPERAGRPRAASAASSQEEDKSCGNTPFIEWHMNRILWKTEARN